MRQVLIIGNSGAGKSTLARRLGTALDLPVIHLDVLFWKPGWVEPDRAGFRADVEAALDSGGWVCDGNFGGTWDLRMPRADTIVWIDQPPLLCLMRAIRRVFLYRRELRPDMAEGCQEKLDPKFYAYILTFNRKVRPRLMAAVAEHGAHARLVRLRSDREIDAFVAEARASPTV